MTPDERAQRALDELELARLEEDRLLDMEGWSEHGSGQTAHLLRKTLRRPKETTRT